jgi:hypothetical protein
MMPFSIKSLQMNANPCRPGARSLEADGSVGAPPPRKSAVYLAIHREMARISTRDLSY